jgi:hypothetical protein
MLYQINPDGYLITPGIVYGVKVNLVCINSFTALTNKYFVCN